MTAHWVALGSGGLLVLALAVLALPGKSNPPPAEIAGDPFLVRGFEIYSSRCVACHGASGQGDGPTAKGLAGPLPRNLVEDSWKYGEAPEAVLAVLTNGVKDSAMPAYGGICNASELKATAAYLYRITGRAVPPILREP